MAGSIDNIDSVVFPKSSSGCGNNGNSSFSFLFHPIHLRVTFINITNLVSFSRVEQNALSGGSFSRVNMGNNADISDFI